MEEIELIKIEQKLGIILPDCYKAIVIDNPFREEQKWSYVNTSILDNADKIISINIDLRMNGYQNRVWPANYFVFGYGEQESYYFLNISKREDKIFLVSKEIKFNPKAIGSLKTSDNFEKFIRGMRLIQRACEPNGDIPTGSLPGV